MSATLEQSANHAYTTDSTSDKFHRELELLKAIPEGFIPRIKEAASHKLETAM